MPPLVVVSICSWRERKGLVWRISLWMVLVTLAIQLTAYGLNLFVVLTPHRAAKLPQEAETAATAMPVS